MSKIVPTGDNVVVEPVAEEVSSSGIIIPESASKEKPMKGTVVAVGPGELMDDGTRKEMEVSVGDVVLFSTYVPKEVKVEGKDMYVLSAADIFGKLV